ncbi:MAG TPA: HEPN domain-containing protein [bacterium]|nr:HEPN domain-containing protein [bacterium]HPP29742.1 HEPN domain-containing protein [bacterium]
MNRWNDWYTQGKRDFEKAQMDFKNAYYEWACFTSQQATEKVVKATSMKIGLILWGHSITEMLNLLSEKIEIPQNIKDAGRLLDLYYIPPRYPNGFPSGKPSDYFTEKQAKEAIDAADKIIRFCEMYINR